jgi:hypothetical protein
MADRLESQLYPFGNFSGTEKIKQAKISYESICDKAKPRKSA